MYVVVSEGTDIANPTITYDSLVIFDTYRAVDNEISNNMNAGGGDGTAAISGDASDDWFLITAEPDEAADEWYIAEYTSVTSGAVSSFPYYMIVYKTSDSSTGMGLIVRLEYSDHVTQEYILGDASTPMFSDTWTVHTGTCTETTKTHEEIHFQIDDSPDSTQDGVNHYAYIDFVMLYGGTFTFPFVSHSVKIIPRPRVAEIEIPGRYGDITQQLGAKSPIIELRGTMDDNALWKVGPTGTSINDAFDAIYFQCLNDPWVWLTTDHFVGKVRPLPSEWMIPERTSGNKLEYTFRFVKADTTCGSNYGYRQYWGLAL
jgi:hypothetical protein